MRSFMVRFEYRVLKGNAAPSVYVWTASRFEMVYRLWRGLVQTHEL